jgi:pyridoxal phosphate enzyme (YggS family)
MYLERLQRALPDVKRRIERAVERAGRSDPDAVTLVAVTKGHSLEALFAARDAGLRAIGENRVQEGRSKHEQTGDLGLDWHLIGHLQRNKAGVALRTFTLIHSLDSLRLARAIDREAEKLGVKAAVLVQVNASGEGSKQGFPVEEGSSAIGEICQLPHLRVQGLMTMAPFTGDEETLRSTFRRTVELYEKCSEEVERFEARHLSMGMTNDFEIAIEEGANMVRLGTVLFGER